MRNNVLGNSATATTCTGNSATATKLQTERNIKLNGAISGDVNFDGSTNVEIKTKQNNLSILTGNVSLNNGSGNVDIAYPETFTRNNCVPIAVSAAIQGWDSYYSNSGMHLYDVALMDDKIKLSVNSIDSIGSSKMVGYKIILMKIEEV